jgi:hypothetical protein
MTTNTSPASTRWSKVLCLLAAVAMGLSSLSTACADDKRPTDPREMFRFLGVGDSYFEQLTAGVPVDADELDPLLRILFKMRQFPIADLDRWAQDEGKLSKSIGQSGQLRGSIFRLRGEVIGVEPRRPSADQAARYEMQQYFRCRLRLDSPPCFADVYTEHVPASWRKGGTPNVAGGACGVFLKLAKKVAGHDVLVFVTPRVAWYSDDLLGQLGMDYGLLDDLRHQENLTVEERKSLDYEAFYQMLAAVGRAKPGELLRQADADLPKTRQQWRWTDAEGRLRYSVIPLYNQPATQIGRLVTISGTARLIEEVRVEDPATAARFGFDHYYQVSIFTDDLEGSTIISPHSPLTFCVRELPDGMPYGNLAHYGESVRVAGFFFKTWEYRIQKMADPVMKTGQLSPLLIGRSLVWYPPPKPVTSTVVSAVIIGLLIVLMLGIWGVAWRSRRVEQQRAEHTVPPPQLDTGIELSQVPAEPEPRPDGQPDFGQIAKMDHGHERQDNA